MFILSNDYNLHSCMRPKWIICKLENPLLILFSVTLSKKRNTLVCEASVVVLWQRK